MNLNKENSSLDTNTLESIAAGAFLEKYGRLDHEIKKDGFKISEKIHMLLESQTLLSNAIFKFLFLKSLDNSKICKSSSFEISKVDKKLLFTIFGRLGISKLILG